ncbi:DUF5129 domain-containing protein [Arthrobacter sp. BF1]|uniref:DUF5129 domain-containing protein n=1 Tax=Arthrobacter sp. BF1 TaxID=2821145 RepID=UPI001C4E7937|nr:DUF5129 domain-containing protein [Arthrobacter sp. BF1]
MTPPLIRVHKKPRFGLPWLALLLGFGTVFFAVQGYQTVTASPTAQLEIVVEGQHGLNISQESVDAVVGEGIKTWHPMRMLVTPRILSLDEKKGREDLGADVILSTVIDDDPATNIDNRRFAGAGIYPASGDIDKDLDNTLQIRNAFMDNVGLGHGPKAVVAAAQRAAEVLDDGPLQSPLFWLMGVVIGFGLTSIAAALSLSRRKRRELIFRRLSKAQRQLATVVLELEALEVSYLATPVKQRTAGFTSSWRVVRDASLQLARTENAVIDAVYSPKTALAPATASLVTSFESEAARLVVQADALMAAGAVLGTLSGRQGVLDRLAAPMTFATRELLARLSTRPPGAIAAKRVRRLNDALESLLRILSNDHGSPETIQAWRSAENELEKSALAVNRSLRRHRLARVWMPEPNKQLGEYSALRSGLGLSPTGSERTLKALRDANAAAHALCGPLPGTTESPVPAPREFSWLMFVPKPSTLLWAARSTPWLFRGVGIVLVSVIASAVFVGYLPSRHSNELTGNLPLHSLVFDGDTTGLDESQIRRYFDDKFTQQVDITVAVRSATDYLGIQTDIPADDSTVVENQEPQVLVDALWRVKAEFPQILDQSTAELRENHVIIPVWKLGENQFSIPTPITGAVAEGEFNSLGSMTWDQGSYYFSGIGDITVARTIENLALGIQENSYQEPEVNTFWLFVLLALSIGLGTVTLILAISYGGVMSTKLGRFGRNSATLRQVRTQLNELALGLDDSRLNAVAMLGSGSAATSAESDQRIFEGALAMAWRMADDLAARSLSGRLGEEYVADVEKLELLVKMLSIRDTDVNQRTRALLGAALGRDSAK